VIFSRRKILEHCDVVVSCTAIYHEVVLNSINIVKKLDKKILRYVDETNAKTAKMMSDEL